MSRRHEALIPLTHDHHHALRNARSLRIAADEDAAGRLAASQVFVEFFRQHSVTHFREEEEVIFPLVVDHPEVPMDGIVHVLADHVRIHAIVRELEKEIASGAPDPETMRHLAQTLVQHVRYEEDELFPAIERLAHDDLPGISLAPRDRSNRG